MNPQDYIKDNYKSQTVQQMVEATGLKKHIIRKIMLANGWENVNSRNKSLYQPVSTLAGMFDWRIFQDIDFIFKPDCI